VDQSNDLLKEVVGEINQNLRTRKAERSAPQDDGDHVDRVKWAEARHLFSKDMLDDHVYLSEERYRVWDTVLWPLVAEVYDLPTQNDG
jgi:hypothetical protein